MIESKRIRRLRMDIIQELPRFNPNNKASKAELERLSPSGLFIHYINWRMRLVAVRPRVVEVTPSASGDARWIGMASDINILLEKVRLGGDLKPHLSLAAWTQGYTPAASAPGPNVDRWADKDFLLNVMGFHHFHLGRELEDRGFVTRTNDVLFAHVSRRRFEVIGIFDHSAFYSNDPDAMPAERQRLWELYEQ